MPTTGKATGRTSQVWFNARNISGDLNSVNISVEAETPEITTFRNEYHTMKENGLKGWTTSWDGFFNDTTTTGSPGVEEVLTSVDSGGSAIVGAWWHDTTACDVGYEGAAVLQSYNFDSPVDGAITANATFTGSVFVCRTLVLAGSSGGGIESGSTAASTSTCSINLGANVTDPLYGFFRLEKSSACADGDDSGSMQVTVQHSNDDTSFTDLLTFTTVDLQTSPSTFEFQFDATGASQYIRAQYALTGCAASAHFLISAGCLL